VQAYRQLLKEGAEARSAFARTADHLVTLLPELEEHFGDVPPPPSLEPEQARFRLLEAMASTLGGAARHAPILIVLEDLHAADSSSVALLEFISKLIGSIRVLIVGTLRDSDALWSAVAPGLVRVQRQAQVLPLARLSKDQVGSYLSLVLPDGSSELLDPLYRATEGHPLFVVEMARLVRARGDRAAVGPLAVPATVKIAIRERLECLSAETLHVLQAASAFGRDVPHAPLAALLDGSRAIAARAVAVATERAVLVDAVKGVSRFDHMLFQEVLHQDT
jgi:predicted ATPase